MSEATTIDILLTRIDRLESKLDQLLTKEAVREFYTTAQFADRVGKSKDTIAGHCQNGRIRATRKRNGRGGKLEYSISHDELLRFERDGLLPPQGSIDR